MSHIPLRTWARHTARAVVLMALAAVAGAGCGGEDERPARWSLISATIAEPSCATLNCHSEVAQRGGVVLHDREEGYRSLFDRNFVIPGNPQDSALLYLLRGEGSLRMPPDFPLPNADIDLIAAWIMAGAMND